MVLSENAKIVLKKRYLLRDENNNITETPEGMLKRVAKAVAMGEKIYDKNADIKSIEKAFYDIMANLEFLPNSPTLMNAGKPDGQLSACFVLPVNDSMEEIFETIKHAALIHKSGGGTGFSFSRLRPKGAVVKSTGGIASGPVSFMKVFNAATEAVKQGGTRRGANMGILRIDHPDILEFIDCKKDNKDITNFNISVGITESFMEAVKQDKEYPLISPETNKTAGTLKAKEVYDKIVRAAWTNGEPGIIFLDRINKFNTVPSLGEIESTNPCGEQPLLPYESCNLGSINLNKMLKQSNGIYEIDWDKLEDTVSKAVHFLDNVIDINKYPIDIIEHTTKQTRKIGLGVMGFADILLRLKIPYNSEKAVETAEKIMSFIKEKGTEKSRLLAKTRGSFPLFDKSVFKGQQTLRNASITTIAPTGTLSVIANCSSGVEPVFGYVYTRNILDNTELLEVNPILKEELQKRNLSSGMLAKTAKEGTLANVTDIPDDIKKVFVSAHDISPEYHIKIQAAFQKYTDNAVSKTVNLSHNASAEDVDRVYMLAYKMGCKGVTIYRDGSRESQVLSLGKTQDRQTGKEKGHTPRPRPEIVSGFTEKVRIGCGNLYITVNFDDKGIVEVFTNTGKGGGCPAQSEAAARLVSVSLRSGVDVNTVIEQLKGIKCSSTMRQQGIKASSCPDAIAKVIEKVAKIQKEMDGSGSDVVKEVLSGLTETEPEKAKCPECGKPIEHEGGCVICRNCGYSKCG